MATPLLGRLGSGGKGEGASAAAAPNDHTDDLATFLARSAVAWPKASGALALLQAAPPDHYAQLAASEIATSDREQIELDLNRSTVDGLASISAYDAATAQSALGRLLHAWCARRPAGYCQGMNFVAAVLLAVMSHREAPLSAHLPAHVIPIRPRGEEREVDFAAAAAQAGSSAAEGVGNGEEVAFWTFVALIELCFPADFYAPPAMAGLQREARALQQLARREAPTLYGSTAVARADLDSILALVAYKWFVPCFVDQMPLPTLLLAWDRLLFRPMRARPVGLSAAHLRLALSVLASSEHVLAELLAGEGEEAVGHGFNHLLEASIGATSAVVKRAEAIEVCPEQLAYLRSRLAATEVSADAARQSRDEVMTPLETIHLALLSRRSPAPILLLKRALLLQPLPPPPGRLLPMLPGHLEEVAAACATTFVAFLLLALTAAGALFRTPSSTLMPGLLQEGGRRRTRGSGPESPRAGSSTRVFRL